MAISDGLELAQVLHHRIGSDPLAQPLGEFPGGGACRHRLRGIGRPATTEGKPEHNGDHNRQPGYPPHSTQVRRTRLPFSRCEC